MLIVHSALTAPSRGSRAGRSLPKTDHEIGRCVALIQGKVGYHRVVDNRRFKEALTMMRMTTARSLRRAALAASVGLTSASLPNPAISASCTPGAQDCPIPVHMARGTDTITLQGRLVQNGDCCAYALDARAGQTLTWTFEGPNERATITYPDGEVDGPGIPTSIPLTQTGTHVLSVRPNVMAGDAFGPFSLTITIK